MRLPLRALLSRKSRPRSHTCLCYVGVQYSLAHVRLLLDERVTLLKAYKSIATLLDEFALGGTFFLRGFRHRGKVRDCCETMLISFNHISECMRYRQLLHPPIIYACYTFAMVD